MYFFTKECTIPCGLENNRGEGTLVEEMTLEEQVSAWEISHPWLAGAAAAEEDDVDEVIRYTLDEIRYA